MQVFSGLHFEVPPKPPVLIICFLLEIPVDQHCKVYPASFFSVYFTVERTFSTEKLLAIYIPLQRGN